MKRKYTRGNPKYRSGMIFVHRKNPRYIIKLLEKGQFNRWICEVMSGEPHKNASGVYRVDMPKDVSAGIKSWLNKEGIRLVQYSTCAFSVCFSQSEFAEVLYSENL